MGVKGHVTKTDPGAKQNHITYWLGTRESSIWCLITRASTDNSVTSLSHLRLPRCCLVTSQGLNKITGSIRGNLLTYSPKKSVNIYYTSKVLKGKNLIIWWLDREGWFHILWRQLSNYLLSYRATTVMYIVRSSFLQLLRLHRKLNE